jgi:hypothetical protein
MPLTLVVGWLLGFTRPGTLTMSWFIVACDTTTTGCLAQDGIDGVALDPGGGLGARARG